MLLILKLLSQSIFRKRESLSLHFHFLLSILKRKYWECPFSQANWIQSVDSLSAFSQHNTNQKVHRRTSHYSIKAMFPILFHWIGTFYKVSLFRNHLVLHSPVNGSFSSRDKSYSFFFFLSFVLIFISFHHITTHLVCYHFSSSSL